MTYITENIIAMGFPAGDLSSGIFGYFEVSVTLKFELLCIVSRIKHVNTSTAGLLSQPHGGSHQVL